MLEIKFDKDGVIKCDFQFLLNIKILYIVKTLIFRKYKNAIVLPKNFKNNYSKDCLVEANS